MFTFVIIYIAFHRNQASIGFAINCKARQISESTLVIVQRCCAGQTELLNCLHSLMKEQYECLSKLASSTLSVTRLAQQMVVIERHFIAVARHKHPPRVDIASYQHRKRINLEANLSQQKRLVTSSRTTHQLWASWNVMPSFCNVLPS